MRTVYKYLIEPGQILQLQYQRVVHVGLDPATATPAMWVEVNVDSMGDPDETNKSSLFRIIPTGSGIGEDCHHIGSVIQAAYVWHIYRMGQ